MKIRLTGTERRYSTLIWGNWGHNIALEFLIGTPAWPSTFILEPVLHRPYPGAAFEKNGVGYYMPVAMARGYAYAKIEYVIVRRYLSKNRTRV